jgi:predicted membrane metal-binding protein
MLRIRAERRELAVAVAKPGSGDGGGFAAAVIAGDQSLMSPAGAQTLQNSGLAHLVSVSGLRMGLEAGMVFALVWRSSLGSFWGRRCARSLRSSRWWGLGALW